MYIDGSTGLPSDPILPAGWDQVFQPGVFTEGLPSDYDLDGRVDLLITDASPTWRVLRSKDFAGTTTFELVDTQVPRGL